MNKEIFLIDTNSLIIPQKQFYPFDFAQGFWEQMKIHIEDGSIKILDMVKNEILQANKDDLTNWMKSIKSSTVSRQETGIVSKYAEILQYLSDCELYKKSALMEWARVSVADPWLIATASVHNYTIVTFEKPSGGLNKKNPNKSAKIPDVADRFGVKVCDLYCMMRYLGFRLL